MPIHNRALVRNQSKRRNNFTIVHKNEFEPSAKSSNIDDLSKKSNKYEAVASDSNIKSLLRDVLVLIFACVDPCIALSSIECRKYPMLMLQASLRPMVKL